MGVLENLIAPFAPGWAARRLGDRLAFDALTRKYDAAGNGRRMEGWRTRASSANAEIGPSISKSRDRARDLVRNDPHIRRAYKVWRANTVGKGIVPDQELELFNEWSDDCDVDGRLDFYGIEALVSGTIYQSGECLIRFIPRPLDYNEMKVPLQLQVLEPDHLDHSKTEALKNGGYIIQGVEFNSSLELVAWHIFAQHPGDSYPFGALSLKSNRIPADDMILVYDKERPGQIRGITELCAAIPKVRDLGDYEEAELLRKKIEACFAAFVEQEQSGSGNPLVANEKDDQGSLIEKLAPGIIKYLKPGQAVKFGSPSAMGGFAEFMRDQKHSVAAAAGVTYQQMTGDLSQANYSSMRGGLIEFRGVIEQFQTHVLVHQFCKPVWKRFVKMARLSGVLKDLPERPKWILPAVKAIDPLKDAMADLIAVRSGFKTLPDVITERGGDPAVWIKAMKDINEKIDNEGLVLDSDPRKTAKSGVLQDAIDLIKED